MKQLEESKLCDKILNEKICGEEPDTIRKMEKIIKSSKK